MSEEQLKIPNIIDLLNYNIVLTTGEILTMPFTIIKTIHYFW